MNQSLTMRLQLLKLTQTVKSFLHHFELQKGRQLLSGASTVSLANNLWLSLDTDLQRAHK